MHTPASVARHPLHPMLVPIPIGLWIGSLACDLWLHLSPSPPAWLPMVAFVTMAGGVVGALVAAVPGLVDALSLRHAPKRVAMVHMTINLLVVLLYLVNLRLRWTGNQSLAPLALSLIGVLGIGISGWLGGKMVYQHRVGVDETPQPLEPGQDEAAPASTRGVHPVA
jgi:uncharacterized membrane protein